MTSRYPSRGSYTPNLEMATMGKSQRLGNSYCSSACQQQKTRESERDKERERDREREKEREIDRDREREIERDRERARDRDRLSELVEARFRSSHKRAC